MPEKILIIVIDFYLIQEIKKLEATRLTRERDQ